MAQYAEKIIEQSNVLLETAAKTRRISDILGDAPSIGNRNLADLLPRVINDVSREYSDADISLECPDSATVHCSRFLDEAFHEVLTNAIVHNDRDPVIHVTVMVDETTTTIEVTDNGPGIPKMEGDVLRGASDVKPLAHGKGLGLWIVYWIVRRSGGTINISEGIRRGSTVTFEFPHRET
ncbi:MAG: ATP-binding protein [Natrialbaceae archaeon]|nr:ATP-binding protein [Natrialbaceae archaeon]